MMEPFFKTSNGISDKFLKNNYPEYYDNIFILVNESEISLSERIYLYQNKLTERPKCANCTNKVKFIKFYKGYRRFCSSSCSATHTHKDPEVKKKRILSIIESNNDPSKRIVMTNKSCATKKGFSEERKLDIRKKRENTCIEKYGVTNISKDEDIKNRIVSKMVASKSISLQERTINKILNSGFKILNINGDDFSLNCNNCSEDFTIKRYLFNQRSRFKKTICMKCNPIGKSDFESCVLRYINCIYNGNIIENYKYHKKYEIDIYLPELGIGIECNGLWWHCELYRDKNYHIEKSNFFKERGIIVINIWEDDWYYKTDIIKNRILHKLKLSNNKVFARKCEIREVDPKTSSIFLNDHHIQGNCISKYRLGLYYNDDLVSIATFGKLRRNLGHRKNDDTYELLRFCSKDSITITGSLSRLVKFFTGKYSNNLISYCDASFNNGDSYIKCGFKLSRLTSPNYYWFNKDIGIRINRWNFRKDKLIKMGYDKSRTEIDIMNEMGYYRIWDCGSYLYRFIN